MENNLCIIPARGGSKRIPRKNIRMFLGKPIIAYSINLALKSSLFGTVMVSTEDDEIARVAKDFGAEVPFFRSTRMSDDFATTRDVLIEVLDEYRNRGVVFDSICCIYPTAVLSTLDDLALGYSKLAQYDLVLPVVRFSYPPQRAFVKSEVGNLEYVNPKYINHRSQDLEPVYHDAGQWYWFKPNTLAIAETDLKRGFIEKKSICVQDIDTEEDWEIASIKYDLLQNKQTFNVKI